MQRHRQSATWFGAILGTFCALSVLALGAHASHHSGALTEEFHKRVRVTAFWSRKLEAVGHWYEGIAAASLGKEGRGPTVATAVLPRDLPGGRRDAFTEFLRVAVLTKRADHQVPEARQFVGGSGAPAFGAELRAGSESRCHPISP